MYSKYQYRTYFQGPTEKITFKLLFYGKQLKLDVDAGVGQGLLQVGVTINIM